MKTVLITDLNNEDFQKAFKKYFIELGIDVKNWDEVYSEINNDIGCCAYLGFNDLNEVIGFILFKPITLSNDLFDMKLGLICEFWVDKVFRKKGHGKYLLDLAESYFKENKINKVILTSDSSKIFYERNGYMLDKDTVASNENDVFIKSLN